MDNQDISLLKQRLEYMEDQISSMKVNLTHTNIRIQKLLKYKTASQARYDFFLSSMKIIGPLFLLAGGLGWLIEYGFLKH